MSRIAKLKVGQVWKSSNLSMHKGVSYTITEIKNGFAYCKPTPDNGITLFASGLTKDGGICLGNEWQEVPRECPCGIFRGDCDYHK